MSKQNEQIQYEVSEVMHFTVDQQLKIKLIEYCAKNDITMAQFGRWSMAWFIKCFPEKPPVKGELINVVDFLKKEHGHF